MASSRGLTAAATDEGDAREWVLLSSSIVASYLARSAKTQQQNANYQGIWLPSAQIAYSRGRLLPGRSSLAWMIATARRNKERWELFPAPREKWWTLLAHSRDTFKMSWGIGAWKMSSLLQRIAHPVYGIDAMRVIFRTKCLMQNNLPCTQAKMM